MNNLNRPKIINVHAHILNHILLNLVPNFHDPSFLSGLLSCHPSGVALSYSGYMAIWLAICILNHPEIILIHSDILIRHDDHDATEVPLIRFCKSKPTDKPTWIVTFRQKFTFLGEGNSKKVLPSSWRPTYSRTPNQTAAHPVGFLAAWFSSRQRERIETNKKGPRLVNKKRLAESWSPQLHPGKKQLHPGKWTCWTQKWADGSDDFPFGCFQK